MTMTTPTTTPPSTDLHNQSVHALAKALRDKKVSAVELAQHFLDRSAAHANLCAFVAVDSETTLAQARAADARIDKTHLGLGEGLREPIRDPGDVAVLRVLRLQATSGDRSPNGSYANLFTATRLRQDRS